MIIPKQIQSLIMDFHSRNGMVRREVRELLTFIGSQAVSPLIPLLKDPEDDVRWEAAKALSDIADPESASELVASLEDPNFGVRWLAAEGLIDIGRDSLAPLLKALTTRSPLVWLRQGAHHVLHDLTNKNKEIKEVVAAVITALEGLEPEIAVVPPSYAALDKLHVAA